MMMKFFNLGENQNGTEKAWVKPEIKFLKAKTLEDRPELLEDPVIRAFYESWKERENKTRESGAVSIQP